MLEWISDMDDVEMIDYLNLLKETSKELPLETCTKEVEEDFQRGLDDVVTGRTIRHEEEKAK